MSGLGGFFTALVGGGGDNHAITPPDNPPPPPPVAPTIVVLPLITGAAVEGQTLTVNTGTWSGSPVDFDTQWNRDGEAIPGEIDTDYLLTSADVDTEITATVTATNTVGPTAVTTLPTVPVIASTPTENLTAYRGTLTKAGWGGVNIGALAGTPFVATSSSFELTSGTVAHFTTPTDGTFPTPTTAGDTADLNGGPYVFKYSSAAGPRHVTGTLTINTRANTFTVDLRSQIGQTVGGKYSSAVLTAGIEGRRVELAKGATDFALATNASPIKLLAWRTTGGCTITHEDTANPCTVGNIVVQLCNNITVDGITVSPSDRLTAAAVERAWYINTTSPTTSGLTSSSPNAVTLNNCGTQGRADPTKTVYAIYAASNGAPLDITLTGTTYQEWVQRSFYLIETQPLTFNATGICKTRYWTADACFITPGTGTQGSIYFADGRFMSPMWDSSQSGVHTDTIQFQSGIATMPVTLDLYTMIQADGNVNSQALFSNGGAKLNLTIKNKLTMMRSVHANTISATDATHEVKIGNSTDLQQFSGVYGVEDLAGGNTRNDRPDGAFAPGIVLGSGVDAAHIQLKNMFVQGSITNSSAYVIPASITHLNGSGDVSTYLPNAGWVTSAAKKTTAALSASDVDNFALLDDPRWHDDFDTVYAAAIAAATPATGQVGALKSDGARPLVTFP